MKTIIFLLLFSGCSVYFKNGEIIYGNGNVNCRNIECCVKTSPKITMCTRGDTNPVAVYLNIIEN
jgi:hypothetical protein